MRALCEIQFKRGPETAWCTAGEKTDDLGNAGILAANVLAQWPYARDRGG
jgi:hypothetical protein